LRLDIGAVSVQNALNSLEGCLVGSNRVNVAGIEAQTGLYLLS